MSTATNTTPSVSAPISSIAPTPQVHDTNTQNIFSIPNQNLPSVPAPTYPNSRIQEIKEYLEIIPIFNGEIDNLTQFIVQTEKVLNIFFEDNRDGLQDYIIGRVRNKIQGEAALFINAQNFDTWRELKDCLINSYADKREDTTLIIDLTHCKQVGTSPLEFYKIIQTKLNLLYNYYTLNYNSEPELMGLAHRLALKSFLVGLNDPLGSLIRTKDPKTLEEALSVMKNSYSKELKIGPINIHKSPGPSRNNFAPNSIPRQNFTPHQNFYPQQNFTPRQHFTPRNNPPTITTPRRPNNFNRGGRNYRNPPSGRGFAQNFINQSNRPQNLNYNEGNFLDENDANFLEQPAPEQQNLSTKNYYPQDQA